MYERGIGPADWVRRAAGIGATAIALLVAGCGANHAAAQPKAPPTRYRVSLVHVAFPSHQRLAERSRLVIAVRNAGTRPLPNVAVSIVNPRYGTSVQPFATYLNMAGLESHSRPVWVVDQAPGPCRFSCHATGPGGAVTTDPHTWALGRLEPGATAIFTWAVSAVMAGRYRVHYAVSADLGSTESAVLPDGSVPSGTLAVDINPRPQHETVSDNGSIVRSG